MQFVIVTYEVARRSQVPAAAEAEVTEGRDRTKAGVFANMEETYSIVHVLIYNFK